MKKALILVDIQNDFMPDGALPVPDGDAVIHIANAMIEKFELVVATQDFHPENHGSFAANHEGKNAGEFIELHGLTQILWPVHCVQNTPGSDFEPRLNTKGITKVFPKGTDPRIDSYSGFFDNGHKKATGLGDYLRNQGVEKIYVLGLATDYCVKFTALDAHKEGFETYLIKDGCRGVDLNPGDCNKAIEAMEKAGVHMIESSALF